jgi:hypothetical protein
LVPGSSPGGPTITPKQTALGGSAKPHSLQGFRKCPLDLLRATHRAFWRIFRQILSLFLSRLGLHDCQVQAITSRFPYRSTIYAWTRESGFLASMPIKRDANAIRASDVGIAVHSNPAQRNPLDRGCGLALGYVHQLTVAAEGLSSTIAKSQCASSTSSRCF